MENDTVTKTQFAKLKIHLSKNNVNEPYYRQELTFVKEISPENVSYELYDVMTLSDKSFEIDTEKMYLIIDNNEVFPLENEYENQHNGQYVKKEEKEIMRADSMKISVVAGYNVVNEKVYQMIHPVSSDVMQKILSARIVVFRYSLGPDFINSEIKGSNLSNLKRLIAEF
jgi:hypothetical protein